MNTGTKKIVTAALMAALACAATMMIKIPSPLKGYLNLGDCIVLVSGWMLSPAYAFFAAGFGSALADVFSGYVLYAPATFVIKGITFFFNTDNSKLKFTQFRNVVIIFINSDTISNLVFMI